MQTCEEEVCTHGYASFELSIPSEMAEIPLWVKNSRLQTVFQVSRKILSWKCHQNLPTKALKVHSAQNTKKRQDGR